MAVVIDNMADYINMRSHQQVGLYRLQIRLPIIKGKNIMNFDEFFIWCPVPTDRARFGSDIESGSPIGRRSRNRKRKMTSFFM